MEAKFNAIIQQNEDMQVKLNSLVGRVDKTESDVFDLQHKCDQMKNENRELKTKLEQTAEKVLNQEAQQKRTNLRFYNVAESGKAAPDEVNEYIGNVLGITAIQNEGLKDAFRVGMRRGTDQKPRPIIAKFTSQEEATRVKLAAWKLPKGTSVVGVGEDLPREWAQARAKAYTSVIKPAKEAGKTVRWRGSRCFINAVEVDINDLE